MNNYSFPLNIYINKKHAKKQLYLFLFLTILCAVIFWYTSGKFFTENYYYPKAAIFMFFATIGMIVGVFAQIGQINSKKPIVTLSNEGLHYSYMKLPLIKWEEISKVEKYTYNKEKYLAIFVKNPEIYIERISNEKLKNNFRKRLEKSNQNRVLSIQLEMLDYDISEFENIVRQAIAEATQQNVKS